MSDIEREFQDLFINELSTYETIKKALSCLDKKCYNFSNFKIF
jgi:hypothetical protein